MNIGLLLVIIIIASGTAWFFWERAVMKAREEGYNRGFKDGGEFTKSSDEYKLGYGYQDGYNKGYHEGRDSMGSELNFKYNDGWNDGYQQGSSDGWNDAERMNGQLQ